MKRKPIRFLCCVFCISLLFTSCAIFNPQPETVEKPIRIALTQDILSFDPMETSDIFSEAVLRCIYTSLYDFDEDLKLRKKLVKSEIQKDEYTWELEIHDHVTFQNGEKLTADDVVFSINRALQGGRTQKSLEIVEKAEKIDDTHLIIRSREPYADLLSLFAKAETSIVSKSVVEAEGYDFSQPVGAGPFQLVNRTQGESIELKRYEDYYLEKAKTTLLNFQVIMTEQDRTTAFLNGEVDLLFSVSAYDCNKLRLSTGISLFSAPSTKIEYLSLNNNHAPLDNPLVRRAISYAIDREQIAAEVYHGYSTPATSLIPNGITGYHEGIITYDPAKAKALLEEAGITENFSFTVIAIDTIRKNTLEYIKLNLAEIGIDLHYNLVSMQDAVKMMNAGEHDGILVGWAFTNDPNSVLPLVLGSGSGKTMNSSNYQNPVVDQLLIDARGEQDAQRKAEIYQEINQIVTLDAPMIILQNPMVLCAAREEIQGVTLNPQGLYQYESLYRTNPTT